MSMAEAFASWGEETFDDETDEARRKHLRTILEAAEQLPELTIELTEEDIGA